MVKDTIRIFSRLKPCTKKAGLYDIDADSDGNNCLTVIVPKDLRDGFINNQKEQYKFRFERAFDQSTKQDEIFDCVAKPVVESVLSGYNGTIFAYGQTGSGKTFTITGGPERYADRGIIPRTLAFVFEHFERHPELECTASISYLEIYNDSGFDLLDPKHEASKLEDLPKVTLYEDTDQNIHLKNLSQHQATNEEEALNFLFLGDTNRMIAETPMNQASTRSHCIFTIHVTSREVGSATIRRSKLHLVDLAGSERVHKSGVNGVLLTEAKYINLSLHFLEQVIVALSEKKRSHIPYRNNMMTSVLRDSLGGNCMTTMIATCSVERRNIDETISTCRFAQRVAMIKNDATLNEELDPKLVVARLKREVQELKDQLSLATGQPIRDELTEEECERCRALVSSYLADKGSESRLEIGADMRMIHFCFSIMKTNINRLTSSVNQAPDARARGSPDSTQANSAMGAASGENNTTERAELDTTAHIKTTESKKLREVIQQRDNEINILVGMLKKEKQRNSAFAQSNSDKRNNIDPQNSSKAEASLMGAGDNPLTGQRQQEVTLTEERSDSTVAKDDRRTIKILGKLSVGRQEAFEIFRRDYRHNSAIEENKESLKRRYTEAKQLGQTVNDCRNAINGMKTKIQKHRMALALQGITTSEEGDETEMEYRGQMEEYKSSYKEAFCQLKNMKTEIEHLQHLLEKQKVKLLKDFEIWWAEQVDKVEAEHQRLHPRPDINVPPDPAPGRAWATPLPSAAVDRLRPYSKENGLAEPTAPSPAYPLGPLRESHSLERISTRASSLDTRRELSSPSSSHRGSLPTAAEPKSSIPLTGDPSTDADIMAFFKARQNIISVQRRPAS